MSGYSGNLKKGLAVIHKGELKTVKDWCFLSHPCHNSDTILISFTDGSCQEGFYDIYTKNEIENQIKMLTKKLKLFK